MEVDAVNVNHNPNKPCIIISHFDQISDVHDMTQKFVASHSKRDASDMHWTRTSTSPVLAVFMSSTRNVASVRIGVFVPVPSQSSIISLKFEDGSLLASVPGFHAVRAAIGRREL